MSKHALASTHWLMSKHALADIVDELMSLIHIVIDSYRR
jgi:hypothetical protein